MSRLPPVTITVYPYEVDAYGHLNEAAYLQLFERARWEALARGPGIELFRRHGIWPAVRRAVVDYHHPAFPGDVIEVEVDLTKLGRTSLELRHRARRTKDDVMVAEAHLVFVMIDGSGNPTPVPDELAEFFGSRVSTRPGELVRYDLGDVTLGVDVRGDGPALLMIHGYPLDRTIWANQVATLSGWRRIAPDLRGMGASDAPADGYSMEAYATDLVRLLDKLHIRKAVIAGLSMGGYIVFEILRRYQDRVSGLILCNTQAGADSDQARHGRDEAAALAKDKGAAAIAERMAPRLLGKTTLQTQPHVVAQLNEIILRASVPGLVGALRAMRDRPDSTALLRSINVPTLVLAGEEDEITPPALTKAMAGAIPSAAMRILPGAGHLPPLETPTAVSRVFAEFLEAVRES